MKAYWYPNVMCPGCRAAFYTFERNGKRFLTCGSADCENAGRWFAAPTIELQEVTAFRAFHAPVEEKWTTD